MNGGLVQNELTSPHNDWWTKSRKLPLGNLKPDTTVAKILQRLVEADVLTAVVPSGSWRLAASPEYRKTLRSRTMQEQLRLLFCPLEVNIESNQAPLDAQEATIQIPAGFIADPRLGASDLAAQMLLANLTDP